MGGERGFDLACRDGEEGIFGGVVMQAVVAALALRQHFDELRRREALQVHAGGRGCDTSNGSKLGRGAGVHEAREHAVACELDDGGGDIRRRQSADLQNSEPILYTADPIASVEA
jgi:hypothetical protein